MRFLRRSQFEKRARKLPIGIRKALIERLKIFEADPHHPLLNDHALQGDRTGFRSINITGDWRLVYQHVSEDVIVLNELDTHHNLYGT